MPKIKYKDLARALRQDLGQDVANIDDVSLVQAWITDNPQYKNDVIFDGQVGRIAKRTGNLLEDLKTAEPLPRTAVAPQRGRSGFEAPMSTPFTGGFVGGEMAAPQRPAEDIEFLPTTYSNTLEGQRILDFTKGKKDVESIRDYFTSVAQEGAVGSESKLAKTAALRNALDVNRRFAEEQYNDLYPDAPLSWSDFMAKYSDPQLQQDREILGQELTSLFGKMKYYEAMGDEQSYNQAKQSADEIANQYDSLFGEFEQVLQVASPLLEQFNQYGQELNQLNEEANKEAQDIEETSFFGKAALSLSRFGAGLGYVAADLFSTLGATGIGDKMKSGLMDSQLSTKDPRMAAFKAPYNAKEGGFTGGMGNALGFIFEQGLNMIPAIVAYSTPYGRLAQTAIATVGTSAATYDEYANEIDQAAINAGIKVDPQTRMALASLAAVKTGLIENIIPINKFIKLGMAKSFADNAVKALASGKSLEVVLRGGIQGMKAFAAAEGVEISEEIIDQLAQEAINTSIRSQIAGIEEGSEQFARGPIKASDYKDIVVNTAIAVAPLGGVGLVANGVRFKNDLYHHVGRNGDVDAVLDLFEENKDKFKAESYKKNTERLKQVASVYESIPQEFSDENARKVADNMLEIDRLDGQLSARTSSSQKETIEKKITKLQNEINAIYQEEQGRVAPTATQATPAETSVPTELQVSESDQNVLNLISERIEPILNPLAQRMTNAEEIEMSEIESVAEQMIDEQSRILASENLSEEDKQSLSQLIESQIDNLLDYEFATITTTEQTGQARQVKGVVRFAKPGLPQKVSTDRFFGTPVTNPQTGERGFLVLTKVPITQSRTGLKYQFVSEAEMKRQKNGEYKAQQGILKLGDEVAPSTPFTNMEYVSSNFGEDGNLTSVVLRDAQSGTELQIDDQELALDIAIAESQKQIGTVPQGALLSTIQRVVPAERLVKVFPNLRETGTTPAAVGVEPQTEQDVRQETNASQEGRGQGEDAAPVPQEEGRQEGQVTPPDVAQEGETPPATAKKPRKTAQEKTDEGKAIVETLKEALRALKAKPDGGANIDLTFGVVPITKAVWNTAIDTAILAIEAGQSIAQAVKAASDYISSKIDGDWGKAKAEKYMENQLSGVGTSTQIDDVANSAGISPKNFRDLYRVNRELFGLNQAQAMADAIAMDRMINVMAKRAGITKEEMYGRLKFEKSSKENLAEGVKFQVDAWHGSPYQFDKFKTENIGTGEGQAAFGWGLYFTSTKKIAEFYAKKLAKSPEFKYLINDKAPEGYIKQILDYFERTGFDGPVKANLINYIKDDIQEYRASNDTKSLKEAEDALKFIRGATVKTTRPKRNLYKVSLQEGKTPDQYTWLEWSSPIGSKVKDIVKKNEAYLKGLISDTYLSTKAPSGTFLKESEVEKNKILDSVKDKILDELINSSNGKDFYNRLSRILASDEQASLFLLENGIDGVKYSAGTRTTGPTSKGFNYVVFDENAISIEKVIKFQEDAIKARGAVMVSMDGRATIYALSDPNVSTPLHELAHVFEHYLTDEERSTVQQWAKTKDWNIKTSESFARGFEKYLAEGKAPTPALQKIFDNFKQWLTDIYRGIVGSDIDIELNKPMRDLYAKMFEFTGEDGKPQQQAQPEAKPEKTISEQRKEFRETAKKYFDGLKKMGVIFDAERNAAEDKAFIKALTDYIKLEIDNGMVTFKGFIDKASALTEELKDPKIVKFAKTVWAKEVVKAYPKVYAKLQRAQKALLDKELAEARQTLRDNLNKLLSRSSIYKRISSRTTERKVDKASADAINDMREEIKALGGVDALSDAELISLTKITEDFYKEGKANQQQIKNELKSAKKAVSESARDAITNQGEKTSVELQSAESALDFLLQSEGKNSNQVVMTTEQGVIVFESADDFLNYAFTEKTNKDGTKETVPSDPRATYGGIVTTPNPNVLEQRETKIGKMYRSSLGGGLIYLIDKLKGKNPSQATIDFFNGIEKAIFDGTTNQRKTNFKFRSARRQYIAKIFRPKGIAPGVLSKSRAEVRYSMYMMSTPSINGEPLVLTDENGVKLEGVSIGEVMYLYQLMKDPHFLTGDRKIGLSKKSMFDIIDFMNSSEGKLGKEVIEEDQISFKELADKASIILEANGISSDNIKPKKLNLDNYKDSPLVAEILGKIYGKNIPENIEYFPSSVESSETEQVPDVDALIDNSPDVNAVTAMAGFFIDRQPGGKVRIQNYGSQVLRYYSGMSNTIAKLPVLKLLQATFDKANKNLIGEYYGSSFLGEMKENIYRYVTMSQGKEWDIGLMKGAFGKYFTLGLGVQMFFNLGSAISQLASAPGPIIAYGIRNYVKGLALLWKNKNSFKTYYKGLWDSPLLQERFGSRLEMSSVFANIPTGERGVKETMNVVNKAIISLGILPTSFADAMSVMASLPIYVNEYEKNLETMNSEDAKTNAENETMLLAEKFLQTRREELMSSDEAKFRNTLYAFATIVPQMHRQALMAFKRMQRGEGDFSTNMSVFIWSSVGSQILFRSIRPVAEALFQGGDDEEERAKLKGDKRLRKAAVDIVSDSTKSLSVTGAFLSVLVKTLYQFIDAEEDRSVVMKMGDILPELADAIPALSIKVRGLRDVAFSIQDEEQLKALTQGLQVLTNFPSEKIRMAAVQMSDGFTSDYINGMDAVLRLSGLISEDKAKEKIFAQMMAGEAAAFSELSPAEIGKYTDRRKDEYNVIVSRLAKEYVAATTDSQRDLATEKLFALVGGTTKYTDFDELSEQLFNRFDEKILEYSLPEDVLKVKKMPNVEKINFVAKEAMLKMKTDPQEAISYIQQLQALGAIEGKEEEKIYEIIMRTPQ